MRFSKLDPDTVATLEALRSAHYNIGRILHLKGDLAGALASFQAGLAANERLARVDAGNSDRQLAMWDSHTVIGEVLQDQGRLADALTHYAAAQDIAEGRSKADPAGPQWQHFLAASYSRVAGVKLAKGDRVGALALWRKALATAKTSAVAVEQDETKSAGKPGTKTAEALRSVGWQALVARDFSKADGAWRRAGALVQELVWPDIGHAHVLLFRNRLREARALYLKNKGKGKFVDGRTWEEGIDGARVLAVMSREYLQSQNCMKEATALDDQRNSTGRLILLNVDECRPLGLLRYIDRVNLVDMMNRMTARFAYRAIFASKFARQYAHESPVVKSELMPAGKGTLVRHQSVFGRRERKPKWKG